MQRFFSEVGLPIFYHQHRLLTRAGAGVFAYRLIAFASTLLSALAVYFISLQLGYLDPSERRDVTVAGCPEKREREPRICAVLDRHLPGVAAGSASRQTPGRSDEEREEDGSCKGAAHRAPS